MSAHKSFYEEVLSAGGILDLSSQSPPLAFLCEKSKSYVYQMRDGINRRSNMFWPLGDIKVELVANKHFNAFAHHDGDEEGIAVFAGLFYLLFDLSCALWSHSRFLTRLHPTTHDEQPIEQIVQALEPLRRTGAWPAPLGIYPQRPERAMGAYSTAVRAFSFIALHEIGHLVRAHVPYLRQRHGLPSNTFMEHPAAMHLSECAARRRLEADADTYAARALADNAMSSWKLKRNCPINFPLPLPTLEVCVADVWISLALVFFCMDIRSEADRPVPSATHPLPATRLGISFFAVDSILRRPFKIHDKVSVEAIMIAYQEVRDFWEVMQLPCRTLRTELSEALKQGAVFMDEERVEDLSAELRSVMDNRLRRFGTTAAHYDQFAAFYSEDGSANTV